MDKIPLNEMVYERIVLRVYEVGGVRLYGTSVRLNIGYKRMRTKENI